MFAKAVLTDEERAVDPQLGFPRGYAKLCRHAHVQAQGLISPFTEGPPQCFHPYAPKDEEIEKFKEYDELFPFVNEEQRDATNPKKLIDSLWQQLDHMGNAGFDPAMFRVDAYGNVLYWDADPGSPLAWVTDHWFPRARGGKTVLSNLKLVQWQASQRKGKKLEFLVPWWDLQLGVSVNQFLSVFASKNTYFRHRAFSFFFSDGDNDIFNGGKAVEGHSWPHHFRDKKNQVGLAAAALVQVRKGPEGALRSLNSSYRNVKQEYLPLSFAGHCEETVKRDLQNVGIEFCKDHHDKKTGRGQWQLDKENKMSSADKYLMKSAAQLQEERIWKQSIEEQKKHKMEESVQLEEELQMMKVQNVKEKVVLDQLEKALAKQKKRVEKQRQWSETQSQYRLCLEKMIRDTLHQCVVYKEQTRLNQAACDALLARLDLQKSACDAAETDLLRKVKQREDLEITARSKITKRGRKQGDTDVGSSLKPNIAMDFKPSRKLSDKVLKSDSFLTGEEKGNLNEADDVGATMCQQPNHLEVEEDVTTDQAAFDDQQLRVALPNLLLVRDKYSTKINERHAEEASDMPISGQKYKSAEIKREPFDRAEGDINTVQGLPGVKRKCLEATDELDVVLLGYEYQENEDEDANANREESVGDNGTTHNSVTKNYSDEDEDDAAKKNIHHTNGSYEESNNNAYEESNNACEESDNAYEESNSADSLSEKEVEESEAGVTVRSEGGEDEDEDAVETGSFKAGDGDEEFANLSKISENEHMVEGRCRAEKGEDVEQLDELLQQVLVMQDKVNEAMVEAIREEQDEERVKKVGKRNLDKWLQKLLLDSGYSHGDGEPTSLISLQAIPECANNGSEGEKQHAQRGVCRNRGFTQKGKAPSLSAEEETTGQEIDPELVEAVRGAGVMGGLWKKISFKHGGYPGVVDTEHPMSVLDAEKTGVSGKVKKPDKLRSSSPWRWVSPVSTKRSASAGGETRVRRLSPWRRNSREDKMGEDKMEERRMMESFSKLKLGGDKQRQEAGGTEAGEKQEGEKLDASSMVARQESKTSAQTPLSARGERERSLSTPPPVKTQFHQMTISAAPTRNVDASVVKAQMVKQRYRRNEISRDMEANGAKNAHAFSSGGDMERLKQSTTVGGNGGAARKASMLKKSASKRGEGGGGGGESATLATRFEENGRASLFEDMDSQDGLRASLSLAWKKAVKKFELGKLPSQITPAL